MEPKGNEPEGYKVISYHGPSLPAEFQNLILAPFLNSLRYGNDLFKLIDKESYYKAYGRYVEILLKRENTIVRLAMLDDRTVLGWSLCEKNILHYVWVKKEVRRQGIARALVPKNISSISHITNKGLNIWANKMKDVKFDPFV